MLIVDVVPAIEVIKQNRHNEALLLAVGVAVAKPGVGGQQVPYFLIYDIVVDKFRAKKQQRNICPLQFILELPIYCWCCGPASLVSVVWA